MILGKVAKYFGEPKTMTLDLLWQNVNKQKNPEKTQNTKKNTK